MTVIEEVEVSQLKLVNFAEPDASAIVRRRLVQELYLSGKLNNLLSYTKVLKFGKKLYAFENFFLIKAVSLELPNYCLKAVIIDEKQRDNLIPRIVNQAVADAAGSHDLTLLPSFDKTVQETFNTDNIQQITSRTNWAGILGDNYKSFYYRDKKLKPEPKQQTHNALGDNKSEFNRAALDSIPKRKK
ncbi:MAG: hypothetical protein ACQEQ2_05585 [Pseudomonadota bacterium]